MLNIYVIDNMTLIYKELLYRAVLHLLYYPNQYNLYWICSHSYRPVWTTQSFMQLMYPGKIYVRAILYISRWLQSAKATVLTMLSSFGGGSVGLVIKIDNTESNIAIAVSFQFIATPFKYEWTKKFWIQKHTRAIIL